MAKSRETFNKKEKEKQRQKKKQEKLDKKEARKSGNDKSTDFEDMIAYVDEFGNITSTPPDPTKKKKEIDAESIEIAVPKDSELEPEDPTRKGKVTFFNGGKGFGFIRDDQTGESVFVHINKCLDSIQEGDKVTYETEKTPKGLSAIDVKLIN
ncbi:Cold shock protein CspA [Indibacter alkaliphilus LW1]|jgi:cold shock CspA family protein|uniref:Cold shock protein CspA n=1 Tax=Indibacter alkaliphilus (strain CCUG 57479 / KCTC 22604 / LW1) TaxID=1189612 RepID=S2DHZ4_INDAL|nr:cold shock domain-containing protein [Indibacter alkaliphilus]EOZ98579.1 Cold shock protein CspA [Indibacter alkaliphilus LW1]